MAARLSTLTAATVLFVISVLAAGVTSAQAAPKSTRAIARAQLDLEDLLDDLNARDSSSRIRTKAEKDAGVSIQEAFFRRLEEIKARLARHAAGSRGAAAAINAIDEAIKGLRADWPVFGRKTAASAVQDILDLGF